MGDRVALLVGVSEYGEGYQPLPGTATDLERMKQVLENPGMGGFKVQTLTNPNPQPLREAIEQFFGGRSKDDVLLFYFSGHGALDNTTSSQLYLSTGLTRKASKRLVESSAVEAAWLQRHLVNSRSQQKVVILDCCFSGAAANLLQKGEGAVNLQQLGAQGTVLLASCSAFEVSYQTKGGAGAGVAQSLYTQYLVEGIETGAARQGKREWIFAQDLHEYARKRFQTELAAAMEPQIIVVEREGYGIPVARAPKGDLKVEYRQIVAEVLQENDGEINELDSFRLEIEREELELSEEEALQILTEQQKPYAVRRQKLAKYRRAFELALNQSDPISAKSRRTLRAIQARLSLREVDVEQIEAELPLVKIDVVRDLRDLLLSSEMLEDEELINQGLIPTRYWRLANLLAAAESGKANKWKEAHEETLWVMCEVAGRKSEGWLRVEDIKSFPCEALKAIDRLWMKHSNGKFGFSVQKRIWQDCGSPMGYSDDWKQFRDKVGWRRDQNWSDYSDVAFVSKAPQGHLPSWFLGYRGWRGSEVVLFSRVQTCKL